MYKIKYFLKNLFFNQRRFVNFLAIILVIVIFVLIFASFVNPVIMDTVEIKSKSIATRAINLSISDVVTNSIVYDDLVHIITDEYGNISMLQANSLEINNLSKDVARTTEVKLDELGRNGVVIPIGTFTGIPLFVGRGPTIRIKMMPIGAVSCLFSSHIESAGINQSLHKIYLKVTTNIGVVMPLSSKRFVAEQQVLICESVIIGQVPEVYLYSDQLDTLLNFVPY